MIKGEVWLMIDEDCQKKRPFVVVGHRLGVVDNDVVVCKITTQSPRNRFDRKIEKWKEYGLLRESTVRCSKLFTVKETKLLVKVAQIEVEELNEIKQTIASYILEA